MSASSAICLIRSVNSGSNNNNKEAAEKFEVTPEGIDFLRSIKRPIAIVAIAGAYRCSKSSIMNRIFGPKTDFAISNTSLSCTKGLYISKNTNVYKDENGQEFEVIAMDSEGLNSMEASGLSYDLNIFSLVCLLSDVLLYNAKNAICEKSIDTLGLVVEMTKKIKTNENESDIANFFPAFVFVVRDAMLQTVDDDGKPINAQQYLEKCLKDQPSVSVGKNHVRRTIKSCFQKRDCCLIGVPSISEEELKVLHTIPIEKLSKSYRDGVVSLQKLIKKFLPRPKQIRGANVDGAGLTTLVQAFTDAINNQNETCNLDNICDLYAKQQVQQQYNKHIQLFKSKVSSMMQQQPSGLKQKRHSTKESSYATNPVELHQTLENDKSNQIEQFKTSCCHDASHIVEEYVSKLRDEIDVVTAQVEETNLGNISQVLEKQIREFETSHVTGAGGGGATQHQQVLVAFSRLYQDVLKQFGNSDAIESIWWAELEVGLKLWTWSQLLTENRIKELTKQVSDAQEVHDKWNQSESNLLLKTVEIEQHLATIETLQATIVELKHTAEDYVQLQEKYKILNQIHEQDVSDRQAQTDQVRQLSDQMKQQMIDQLNQHGIVLEEKQQLIETQESKIKEFSARVTDLESELEIATKQVLELKEDVQGIQVWKVENDELLANQDLLNKQLHEYRSREEFQSMDFEKRVTNAEQEALEAIEETRQHCDRLVKDAEEKMELMMQEVQDIKNNCKEEIKKSSEEKNQLNFEYTRCKEENKKLESQLQIIKQELSFVNRSLLDKQEEFNRVVSQMQGKWREEVTLLQSRENQLTKEKMEHDLEQTLLIKSLEFSSKTDKARVGEMEKLISYQYEEIRAAKKLKDEHYAITTKLTQADTELQLLRHDKQERDRNMRELQSQNLNLQKTIDSAHADHRVELFRATLRGASSTTSTSSTPAPRKAL